jgi:hypothetical protein
MARPAELINDHPSFPDGETEVTEQDPQCPELVRHPSTTKQFSTDECVHDLLQQVFIPFAATQ